jgi:hypothetical protein
MTVKRKSSPQYPSIMQDRDFYVKQRFTNRKRIYQTRDRCLELINIG